MLSRFSSMGQLHSAEINFERQPGQIRTVGDSEQSFRNAGGCILQQVFPLLWIGDVGNHTHLGQGIAHMMVQEG